MLEHYKTALWLISLQYPELQWTASYKRQLVAILSVNIIAKDTKERKTEISRIRNLTRVNVKAHFTHWLSSEAGQPISRFSKLAKQLNVIGYTSCSDDDNCIYYTRSPCWLFYSELSAVKVQTFSKTITQITFCESCIRNKGQQALTNNVTNVWIYELCTTMLLFVMNKS